MWKLSAKSRSFRASARSTSAAVASAPGSAAGGFSDNWRASAAAIAELAEGLDFIFEQVNYEEEPGDLLRLHLERLGEEAAKYHNSQLSHGTDEEWTCPQDTMRLLYAACQCSCLVYGPLAQSGPELTKIMSRASSMTGTSKAVSMWKMESENALIVSVKGTASATDHMVNLNSEAQDAGDILGFDDTEQPIRAHRGFLACAKSLIPHIIAEITLQIQNGSHITHIIFAGHSAGGSVSSLIFLHLVSHIPANLSSLQFCLATFGCAPVISSDITPLIKKLPSVGWMFAFVNEYDLVPRADRPYIRSLLDLYRSRHGLPSLTPTPSAEEPMRIPKQDCYKPALTGLVDGANLGLGVDSSWPLPEPAYHLIGSIVILQQHIDMSEIINDDESDSRTLPAMSTRPSVISAKDFGNLLFCDIGVHKRRIYLERLEMMATGKLRGASFLSEAETLYVEEEQSLSESLTEKPNFAEA